MDTFLSAFGSLQESWRSSAAEESDLCAVLQDNVNQLHLFFKAFVRSLKLRLSESEKMKSQRHQAATESLLCAIHAFLGAQRSAIQWAGEYKRVLFRRKHTAQLLPSSLEAAPEALRRGPVRAAAEL